MFSGVAKPQAIVVGLLLVHAALLGYLATRYSPTVDEAGHLPAGLYTWEFGHFDVFRVNPPLTRTLAALPVWLNRPEYDWTSYRRGLTERPEWNLGSDLMRANGEESLQYFTWARWILIPMSLLGGFVCYRWAADFYGIAAGLLALTLWCFSPTVLAYGALITPDLSAAACGVTAAYTFWRWLKTPSAGWTLVAGVTLGLAELTKMTWIILFVLWPLLWLIRGHARKSKVEGRGERTLHSQPSTLNQFVKLTVILTLGLYVLNVGYAFDGSFTRLGDYSFVSRALSGLAFDGGEEVGGNRFAGSWCERLPVPLPGDYVTGLDLQRREFEQGKWSFLCGEWKHGGWWWYYFYAVLIKEPVGTWCLLGLALFAACRVPSSKVSWSDTLAVIIPGLVLFVFVSSQTGFNRYIRYVLPAFPFAFIWASQAVRLITESGRRWLIPVGGAVIWSIASSLWIFPHSLSYFNEAVGGPAGGHKHLIDANIDWGQDLYELRDWVSAHPESNPMSVVCQAYVPLEVLQLDMTPPPQKLQPGWYILSRHDRHERTGRWDAFRQLTPVDQIGESMDVYHITPEDMAGLRKN
ncbi:MAG: glycosyltransferase family 39 protein [Planctomycetaceae bacterium]|nr:glycosyltransferase family 39 protein [Planctomycetaceae bacterium]